MAKLVFRFDGMIDTTSMDFAPSDNQKMVERLNRNRDEIQQQIVKEVHFPYPVTIESFELRFHNGSVIWEGWITLNATMEVMATVGGAYGFLEIIRNVFNNVLASWFDRLLPVLRDRPIGTNVWVVSAPQLDQPPSAATPTPAQGISALTPWQLLVSLTLLNVILFLGGAIYTGVQVDSIQQRYQEATNIINDAESKYREAETSLELVRAEETRIKNRLATIAQTNEETLEDLERRSAESRDRISEMLGEADTQLDALKIRRTKISESMTLYLDETTEELKEIASEVTAKLEDDLNFKSRDIDRVANEIRDLGNHIDTVSIQISNRGQEAANLRASIDLDIRELNGVKRQLEDRLTGGDKLSVFEAWSSSDGWLRTFLVLTALLLLVAICGGLYILFAVWRE